MGESNPISFRQFAIAAGLLWVCGVGLRLTILAIPPLIPLIQADLELSATQIGILSGLPVVMFACAAVPGSLLIARLGVVTALITGLLLTAAGSSLRGLAGNVTILYAATILMGAGVAIMQPALPVAVRRWLPAHIGFGTAVFTNGLVVGEIIPVAATVPLILPWVDNSWRAALAVGSLPLLAFAGLLLLAPRSEKPNAGPAPAAGWLPDWRSGLTWRLGFILSTANSIYFCSNAFLPVHLAASSRADLVGAALTALNISQLPASLLLLAIAGRIERRTWPYIGCGLLALVGVIGMASSAGLWTLGWAALAGFACAAGLVLGLVLPALLLPPAKIGATSAAMFAIAYAIAMVNAVLAGVAVDATGIAAFAFLPIGIGALPMIVLPLGLKLTGKRGA